MSRVFVVVLLALSLAAVVCAVRPPPPKNNPLFDYVAAPDSNYHWQLAGTYEIPYGVGYILNLTSQEWLPTHTNPSIWMHWLVVCVPTEVRQDVDYAIMYIDGGGNPIHTPPKNMDPLIDILCLGAKTVSAHLMQVPNEPIIFDNDGIKRSEDAEIAYGWRKFLTTDKDTPEWLDRLPMTKAAVRAMDAIQEFTSTILHPHIPPIKNFVVAGASKRGWDTYTTGIVDPRVQAIVPLVIPILHVADTIAYQARAYGNWSFALKDYVNENVTQLLFTDAFKDLEAVVDPFSYLPYLDMPKYVICATGDEFFLPDSPNHFWNDLPGEKHLRMVPDAEHSLAGHQIDVAVNILGFYNMFLDNVTRPSFTWELVHANDTEASITLTVTGKWQPSSVKMYHAKTLSHERRDFRLLTCFDPEKCLQPVIWWEKKLSPVSTNTYKATMAPPAAGWAGFFIQAEYDILGSHFKATSEVNIVPDRYPFPPCQQTGLCG